MDDLSNIKISRRNMLITSAISATALSVPAVAGAQASASASAEPAPVMSKLSLNVNGEVHQMEVDTRTTLLDALRENLHLTGHQERLRPRPVRRLHRHRRRPAHQFLPDAWR